jgi:TPR repeat protein
MRTSNVVLSIGLIGLALGLPPAASFDGTRTPERAPITGPLPGSAPPDLGTATPLAPVPAAPHIARPNLTPFEAFRSGTLALRAGKTDQALAELEYAAERGVPAALWKLGRMYADGDGVEKNKLRAFGYFRRLTNTHSETPPGTPQARFVASAFVSLGHYYLEGIPEGVKVNPQRAHEMFYYAASFFGDPDAQFQLGRLYLFGQGTGRDPVQAARWLRLAAVKGQHSAQALLGTMLFKGEDVARQAALGLFWLTVAKDGAGTDHTWITETYSDAFAQAKVEERAMAYKYLENWLRRPRVDR